MTQKFVELIRSAACTASQVPILMWQGGRCWERSKTRDRDQQIRWDLVEIQLAIHSWDLGSPGGTSRLRLLPSWKSIYSLSVYGWLSFEHRLKFSLEVENGLTHFHILRTMRSLTNIFHSRVMEGSYHLNFFLLFLEVQSKQQLIFPIWRSTGEGSQIL